MQIWPQTLAGLLLLGLTTATPLRLPRETDNCDHPFHSFLCNKAPKARAQVQPQASVAIPDARPPPQEIEPAPFAGENSFLDPTFISTTKKTTTVRPTPPPTTPAPKVQLVPDNTLGSPVFIKPKKAKEEDLCAHSFHSFLCQPGKRGRRIFPGKQLVPENSFQSPVAIKPPSTTTTRKVIVTTTTRKTTTTTTPPPPPPEVPAASFDSPSFALPNRVPQAQRVAPVAVPPPASKGEDLCGHAFHAWLCQPGKKKSAPRKQQPIQEQSILLPVALPPSTTTTTTTTRRPTTTTRRPTTTTTTTRRPTTARRTTTTTTTPPPPPPPEVPDASFDSPSFALPNKVQPVRVGLPPPSKGEDLCAHAFHAWLCQPGKRKSPSRKTPIVPEQSILLPVALPPSTTTTTRRPTTTTTTTRRPTTTTRRPTTARRTTTTTTMTPPPPPPPEVPDASFDSPSFALPNKIQPAPQRVAPVAVAPPATDLCSHAFHSFLCNNGAKKRKSNQQPAPSNENSVLLPVFRSTTTTTTTTTTTPRTTPVRRTQPPTTRRTTPRATTTTTRRPPPPPPPKPTTEEPNQIPEGSFDDPQRVNLPLVRSTTPKAHEDLCSHSFHGFLCNRSGPRTRRPIRIN